MLFPVRPRAALPALLLAALLSPSGTATALGPGDLGAIRDLDHPFAVTSNLIVNDVEPAVGGGFLVTGSERGSFDSTIVRLTPDGGYDTSFGSLGGLDWQDFNEIGILEERADGRIITLGGRWTDDDRDLVLHALRPDGSPARRFGADGVVLLDQYDNTFDCGLMLDGGDILVSSVAFEQTSSEANEYHLLTRLRPDGTPDPTFGSGGTIEDAGCRPLVQSDGRIVVKVPEGPVDTSCGIRRFLPDGSLDTSFGTGGTAEVAGVGCRTTTRSDGGLLITSTPRRHPDGVRVTALTAAGAPDPAFGVDGVFTLDVAGRADAAFDVTELSDGRIVVGGFTVQPGTARDLLFVGVTPAGTLDPGFGIDGVLVLDRFGADAVVDLIPDGDRLFAFWTSSPHPGDTCCVRQAITEVLPHAIDRFGPDLYWQVPSGQATTPYDRDRLHRLRGVARDEVSGIRPPVQAAVSRTMTDGTCQWMRADGGFAAGPCDGPLWLPATGTFRFTLDLLRPLRPSVGTNVRVYRAYITATDGAGNIAGPGDPFFGNPTSFEVSS